MRQPAPDRQRLLAAESIVTLTDIDITYTGRKAWFRPASVTKAVQGVSFNVRAGETVALVGASGSGKTTIGKLIAGMLKASRGTLAFRGHLVTTSDKRLVSTWRRECQMIQQDPFSSLDPRMHIAQILEEPLLLVETMNRSARQQRVREVLDEVGLGALFCIAIRISCLAGNASGSRSRGR